MPKREEPWQDSAECVGSDPDLFFNEGRRTRHEIAQRVALAKSICAKCEVAAQCLELALSRDPWEDRWGIFGGLTARERMKLRGVTGVREKDWA